jgi:hypothetical protein
MPSTPLSRLLAAYQVSELLFSLIREDDPTAPAYDALLALNGAIERTMIDIPAESLEDFSRKFQHAARFMIEVHRADLDSLFLQSLSADAQRLFSAG